MQPLEFAAKLRLLFTAEGGRSRPIFGGYRPNFSLGTTWHGRPTLHGATILLDDPAGIAPGFEAMVAIRPFLPDFWGTVRVGSVLTVQEGSRVVGHAFVSAITSRPAFWTPDVAVFVDQARQFCAFVAKAGQLPLDERLRTARERLLALYTAATRLPRCDPPDGPEAGPSPGPPPDWPGFAEHDAYWEVFDPYASGTPVQGSLSDDMLDVFGDIGGGLALWDLHRPEARAAAIWEWRFQFENHWGDHAVDAMRALHRACARGAG